MCKRKHQQDIIELINHSNGGFTHQTLAHALVSKIGMDSTADKILIECLESCEEFERRGILSRNYQSDGGLYFYRHH